MFSNKDLRKLIIPLVIEQLLAVTIGMADTVMVSSCGEAAVSGISLVDSINVLIIQAFSALAAGGTIICTQYLGQKNHEMAKAQVLRQSSFSTPALRFRPCWASSPYSSASRC